jgi:hypothetical protein
MQSLKAKIIAIWDQLNYSHETNKKISRISLISKDKIITNRYNKQNSMSFNRILPLALIFNVLHIIITGILIGLYDTSLIVSICF